MAYDQATFAALARAAYEAATTPAFTPDPDNSAAVAQVVAAVSDAQRRVASHQIAMAMSQRVDDLWPGPGADAATPAAGSLDALVYAAIAFFNATVKE